MTTEAPVKPDSMVKARAALAMRRAKANLDADTKGAQFVQLMAQVATLAEQNKALAEQVQKLQGAPKLPRTPGPERKLQEFIASMKPGEQRDGVRETWDSDAVALEGAWRSGDIVMLKPESPRHAPWRKTLKHDDPIYGQVLQYLGRTKNKRGPRKYKVHFAGMGRDGVTEDELEFVRAT